MLHEIARIVRSARERQSVSLDELAIRSAVSRSVLAELEAGRPAITTTQLDEVARALSLDPSALLNGRETARPVPSIFLRHVPLQDFEDRDTAVLDEALEQGRSLASLSALLAEPPGALQAAVFPRSEAGADRSDAPALEGYRLARSVRRWLARESDPLGDVTALLEERFGIAVVVRGMETSRVTAVSVRADPAAAIVLTPRDVPRLGNPLLARVYLSHELCHVLFDESAGGLHIVVDSSINRKAENAEQRARAFAAEFLLPREGLVGLLGEPRRVRETSAASDLVARARGRFGTSHEITANHLCNLNFVDLTLREWLVATTTVYIGPPPEMSLTEEGAPSRLVARYAERAHREGLLTDGEARTTLGIDQLAPLPWDEVAL